jgi:hypothetical protein
MSFARRPDVSFDGLAAAPVFAGVVQVRAAGGAGAAGSAAVAVAGADVVGEWAAGESGARMCGEAGAQVVAVDPAGGDLGQ